MKSSDTRVPLCSASRCLFRHVFASLSFAWLTTSIISAGTIHLNLTSNTPSGTGTDGTAILGGGIWNRIDSEDFQADTVLVDGKGALTTVKVTETGGRVPSQAAVGGNPVQGESWYNSFGFVMEFSGLRKNQIHEVAVYSDRQGIDPMDEINVNGQIQSITNDETTPGALPGTKGLDYVLFKVRSSNTGIITVSAKTLAGIQIRGVLPGEIGPQADCLITKSSSSAGGKGNDIYGLGFSTKQAVAIKGKTAEYHVNIQNDGSEDDSFYLMGFWNAANAKVKVFDRLSGKDITSTVKAGTHRFDIAAGETKQFRVKIRKSGLVQKSSFKAKICASSSTLKSASQDCVTCVLKRP